MKSLLKRIGLFVVSYAAALLLLFGLLAAIEKAENKTVVQKYVISNSKVKEIKRDTLKETIKELECMDHNIDSDIDIEKDISCIGQKEPIQRFQVQTNNASKQNNGTNTISWFIISIYAIIALTFSLVVDAVIFKSKRIIGIGTMAVHIPPVFGVVGTMYALAMFASASSTEGILQMFRANVADAVVTTIYGIFIYAGNLAILSFREE